VSIDSQLRAALSINQSIATLQSEQNAEPLAVELEQYVYANAGLRIKVAAPCSTAKKYLLMISIL
jgi:hypothetical protein